MQRQGTKKRKRIEYTVNMIEECREAKTVKTFLTIIGRC